MGFLVAVNLHENRIFSHFSSKSVAISLINIPHFIYPHYLLYFFIYPSTPYQYPINTVFIAALNPANFLSIHIISTLAFYHTPSLSLSRHLSLSHLLLPIYLKYSLSPSLSPCYLLTATFKYKLSCFFW